MKIIKNSMSVLLALVMVLTAVHLYAFAVETEPKELPIIGGDAEILLGDVNGDEKVTATDARIILRIATKLEKLETYPYATLVADVNGDDKITATDARIVLRVATKLETFENPIVVIEPTTEAPTTEAPTTEAPTTETPTTEAPTTEAPTTAAPVVDLADIPADIVAFCNGNYYIEGNYINAGESQLVKMAINNGANEILFKMEGVEVGCYLKNKTQLLINYSNKTYTKFSEIQALIEGFGEDFNIKEEINFDDIMVGKINIDRASIEKTVIDGKEAEVWIITSGEMIMNFTLIDGKITRIESTDGVYCIEVITLSAEMPADLYISSSKQFKSQPALGFFMALVKI